MTIEELNQLSEKIIRSAIAVHKNLGPGLLEQVYKVALAYELRQIGLSVECEVPIPCVYKGIKIDLAYRADIIVEDQIILELKSSEKDNPVFYKQLNTYLRLTNKRLGFLINFNNNKLIDGLKRIINGY